MEKIITNDFWKTILNSEKNLDDDEAEDMQKTISELRKEKGFRI